MRLKICGFRNATLIEDVFASDMVDVAYIDEVTPDAIYVVPDEGGRFDFNRPDDFAWVKGVIETTFADRQVRGLGITLVNDSA